MLISAAYAAEHLAEEESLLQSGEFWVGFTFCLVVVLLAKPLGRGIGALLQKRADDVADNISQAEKLVAEADALLAKYKKQCENSEREIAQIMKKTESTIAFLKTEAQENFDRSLKKQEESSSKRLKSEQDEVVSEIRNLAVSLSVKVAEQILKEKMTPEKNRELSLQTIEELPLLLKK